MTVILGSENVAVAGFDDLVSVASLFLYRCVREFEPLLCVCDYGLCCCGFDASTEQRCAIG